MNEINDETRKELKHNIKAIASGDEFEGEMKLILLAESCNFVDELFCRISELEEEIKELKD